MTTDPTTPRADQDGGESPVTYGSYLALDELLALQRPRSSPEHPDELLFIVVHQASELWFKVILHEFDALVASLERRDVMAAVTAVRRINALTRIVTSQLRALDTLPPQRFAQFRGYLGSSSGSQSVQFRAIEAASGLRDPHFLHAIAYREDQIKPTFVVDVSTEFETKMAAIRCYASQFDGATQAGEVYPTGESLYDLVRHKAAHYGSLIRTRYGEPFYTVETMRVDDVAALPVSTF